MFDEMYDYFGRTSGLVGDALRQHTLMYIAHPDAIPPHSTG
jgi:hypothetical protein